MSISRDPKREHPSTYFVQDRSNQDELNRLQMQDQMLTTSMGGVLPEQSDPAAFQRVLDVGCGSGGWLIETAKAYPGMTQLVGVDASARMLDYAREQAAAQGVSDRVEFHVMDALRMLEFPDQFFDLVNQRLGQGYLRTWDWSKLLQEYQRVCRPGGVIRITEGENGYQNSTSPALSRLGKLGIMAPYQAGHLFTPEPDGLLKELAGLLQKAGLQDVQTRAYELHFRAGTSEGHLFAEDMKHIFRTGLPFLRKWTQIPDDYEDLYQQMLREMQQPGFAATWSLLTAWGHPQPTENLPGGDFA